MTRELIPYTEDPKLERKYRNLERLGQELKIPTFRSFLTLEVSDRNGHTLKARKQRSHSWNRNAYNFLFANMSAYGINPSSATFEAGVNSLKSTNGTIWPNGSGWGNTFVPGYYKASSSTPSVNVNVTGTEAGFLGVGGSTDKGIVIGAGTASESFEGFNLETPINDGTSAGQMSVTASNLHDLSYDAPSKTLTNTLIRFFNNNSGGSINIGEVGILYKWYFNSAGLQTFMACRDVLSPVVAVPDTGQLKVTYTIELVYPA
ncbi:hypothetical protein ABFB09_08020 [Dehalogenimonas sp. THU2]|uniref:hypothetical protein n=1 Tax=Dehalogenimonas sp. THU2 TaxID=3151121 RepID=UPI00321859CE